MKTIEVYKKGGKWRIKILSAGQIMFESAKSWPRRIDALNIARSLLKNPPKGIYIWE